ncbi:hypothetical protein [Streptomyces sp. NPDC056132]|uniref:hypothetical protein n=1 Tax=Streptomyces sp. NPDC056132 TaxID=3345722 RepID=UPI0035D6CC4E
MKLALWRILLTPLTSLRALFIQRRSAKLLSYDVAWRQARLDRSPDDMVYRLHGHHGPVPDHASSAQSPSSPPRKDEPTDRWP